MSRLLFAAARGARIQIQLGPNRGWINSTQITWCDDAVYRIHPYEEHLQYGPISSALREDAEDEHDFTLSANTNYGCWSAGVHDWIAFGNCGNKLHRSLFLLILAEALADEGL